MSDNRPFGFDPDDFDRAARELGEGVRNALGKLGELLGEVGVGTVWSSGVGPNAYTGTHPRGATRTTTGDTGDGVWAIVVVDDAGTATVEQVYATELDALRANKSNTDAHRRVRFLPYGIAVSALDTQPESDGGADSGSDEFTEPDPEH